MKITELLNRNSIDLSATPRSKEETINYLIELMDNSGNVRNIEDFTRAVFTREEESTTGVGNAIAIPHGRSSGITTAGLSAIVVPDGVEFASLDGKPVKLAFLIASPEDASNIHLEMLKELSTLLMDNAFVLKLINAKSVDEFLTLIDTAQNATKEELSVDHADYLAVTSCPTGIAHTYMAATALEKAAKSQNVTIKVETRGSGGTKNALTPEEIQNAKGIIVAADTNTPLGRFHDKHVIQTSVSEGINKADDLLKKIIAKDAPIYNRSKNDEENNSVVANEPLGRQIYKHLMNGVSHMLPFVVGGGILIAIAFLIDGLSVDLNSLSPEARGDFGSITELAAFFKNIGGIAFGFMLPILSGYIAMSIADRPGLAVGFVGGALAANGTSGFLGALVAGFLAGYVVITIKKIFKNLPNDLDGIVTMLIIPVFGILITALLMQFVIEPPVGALNTAINNGLTNMGSSSKILLGLLVGGMMAVDMGGPVNKAAYVFGTASIASGNYEIMAAVMIGGMVPPTGIALATLLFKNRFTEEERKAGPTNFIMGLSFITEGAIPFAASDPLRVIPSCIVGSAVAGGLSTMFGATLMAPHGGIFVFPVVGNSLFYLLSLLIGTIVTAVLLGVLKKPIEE